MNDRAQQVGLFRYSLVRELASERLSGPERGAMARWRDGAGAGAREHIGPDGLWVRVSRTSIDRWLRAYREGGFEALVPARTAAQIHRILVETEGWSPSARTIQRHLAAAGMPWRGASPARATGRFEAGDRNELWNGGALHGPR